MQLGGIQTEFKRQSIIAVLVSFTRLSKCVSSCVVSGHKDTTAALTVNEFHDSQSNASELSNTKP
jgi:hypothetical protein